MKHVCMYVHLVEREKKAVDIVKNQHEIKDKQNIFGSRNNKKIG